VVANIIFSGSPRDIYIHWLVLALGIGIFISSLAVISTCRNIAGYFHLLQRNKSPGGRLYLTFFKYHSYYWVALGLFLVLHLMATIVHVGIPVAGEPYKLAHQLVFYASISNLVLGFLVFTSCRSFLSLISLFFSKNPLTGSGFKKYSKYHSVIWWLFSFSLFIHIIAGIIHAVNT
jgi:hypothetical protein